jgi:hypothetical protein
MLQELTPEERAIYNLGKGTTYKLVKDLFRQEERAIYSQKDDGRRRSRGNHDGDDEEIEDEEQI